MEVLLSLGMKGPEARNTISEIYSPPRISQAARSNPGLGIQPGFALDLTNLDEMSSGILGIVIMISSVKGPWRKLREGRHSC
eukprot:11720426-Heterocapsa_arctica.AAC.1